MSDVYPQLTYSGGKKIILTELAVVVVNTGPSLKSNTNQTQENFMAMVLEICCTLLNVVSFGKFNPGLKSQKFSFNFIRISIQKMTTEP